MMESVELKPLRRNELRKIFMHVADVLAADRGLPHKDNADV